MESNKVTAHRFCSDYLGLDGKIITADTSAQDADLKGKCIILFGRPETNAVAERFKDSFAIQFNGRAFSWQSRTYEEPTQGVIEVADHPDHPGKFILLCAGVSAEATRTLGDPSFDLGQESYIVFDGSKELARGHWLADDDLIWTYEQ